MVFYVSFMLTDYEDIFHIYLKKTEYFISLWLWNLIYLEKWHKMRYPIHFSELPVQQGENH